MANLPEPITRKEQYLSNIAGQGTELPENPITREEEYLDYIAKHGVGGTTNYNDLDNKPSINDVELSGNKSLEDLGIEKATLSTCVYGFFAGEIVTAGLIRIFKLRHEGEDGDVCIADAGTDSSDL